MSALDEKGARAAVETMAAEMKDRIFMGRCLGRDLVWDGIIVIFGRIYNKACFEGLVFKMRRQPEGRRSPDRRDTR